MAGRTLCASDCAVQAQCQRHAACPQAYPIHPHWQSYALWQPERGRECEGFAGIAVPDPRWCIGERHPEYGVVQAMGVTGGEAYRWFVADDGVVTMIPLSMLEDEPD